MALPVTIPMLKLADQDVKVLHIEPTDACNAACPQCAREIDTTFDKNNLHHLTLSQIKKLVSDDSIKNLNKMFMCGDYGDPAAGKNTLEIFKYFRTVNPTITLGMNTNGGLRNIDWWRELGNILNKEKDYVIFSIDGLADTNHIYRINVDYEKVINNARSFIGAGGRAHWEMLVFAHNQHQVDLAEETARKLGFGWFRAKVSRRFEQWPVDFLKPPIGWENPIVSKGSIDCQAIKDQSLYISAKGVLYPCCWLGTNDNFTLDNFDKVQATWNSDNPNNICKNACSKNTTGTSFTNQWQREIEF